MLIATNRKLRVCSVLDLAYVLQIANVKFKIYNTQKNSDGGVHLINRYIKHIQFQVMKF